MKALNLSFTDMTREAFGAYRTICDCRACTVSCEWIPGYLIPEDLERLAARVKRVNAKTKTDMAFEEWAVDNLLASPGSLVVKNGLPFRIRTLVPARGADGHSCKFLNSAKECTIHEDAPFGCAFFDSHMDVLPGQQLSAQGLTAICKDWQESGPYAKLWMFLFAAGKVAPDVTILREQMRQAWAIEEAAQRATFTK